MFGVTRLVHPLTVAARIGHSNAKQVLSSEVGHPSGKIRRIRKWHERFQGCLLEGLQWLHGPAARVRVAGKSGISQARVLLAHFAIRGLMHEAATKGDVDPDQISFVHAVRVRSVLVIVQRSSVV